MKTFYIVEIIDFYKRGTHRTWYFDKIGQQFRVEISSRVIVEHSKAGFKYATNLWIDPNHCKVISEIKVKS